MAGICLFGLSGCSIGADKETSSSAPGRGASEQVAATVSALQSAVRAHEWRAVCDDLFTRAARQRAGGGDCARLVGSSAGDLRGARIQLVGIDFRNGGALARVRSSAAGQGPLIDTITLRRSGGRYRIDSLR